MEQIKDLKTQYQIVEYILQTDERARNDDKWLTYRLFRFYTNMYIDFKDFNKVPAFANAQKIRQKIQNKEGRFLPTDPNVLKKRTVREQQAKRWFADAEEKSILV